MGLLGSREYSAIAAIVKRLGFKMRCSTKFIPKKPKNKIFKAHRDMLRCRTGCVSYNEVEAVSVVTVSAGFSHMQSWHVFVVFFFFHDALCPQKP